MKISSGQQKSPYRIVLYGQPGLRKSQFMSCAPGAWFIDPSKGTHRLRVNRIDIDSYDEVYKAIDYLAKLDSCETIVLDEWGTIQAYIEDKIKTAAKVEALKDIAYGTGYIRLMNEMRSLLGRLEFISATKNVAVIGHSDIKTFKNPEGSDYDMYEMACDQKRVWPLFYKWADAILFFGQERAAVSKDDKVIAIAGETKIFTQWSSAYNAKNRFNMPPSIKIDGAYDKFQMYVEYTAKETGELKDICKDIKGYEENKDNTHWLVMASVFEKFKEKNASRG